MAKELTATRVQEIIENLISQWTKSDDEQRAKCAYQLEYYYKQIME